MTLYQGGQVDLKKIVEKFTMLKIVSFFCMVRKRNSNSYCQTSKTSGSGKNLKCLKVWIVFWFLIEINFRMVWKYMTKVLQKARMCLRFQNDVICYVFWFFYLYPFWHGVVHDLRFWFLGDFVTYLLWLFLFQKCITSEWGSSLGRNVS